MWNGNGLPAFSSTGPNSSVPAVTMSSATSSASSTGTNGTVPFVSVTTSSLAPAFSSSITANTPTTAPLLQSQTTDPDIIRQRERQKELERQKMQLLQSQLTNLGLPAAAGPPNSNSNIHSTSLHASGSGSSASGSSSMQTLPQHGQSVAQMTSDVAKNKCKALLSYLIELSKKKDQTLANNVKDLIQGLIDDKISPEDFSDRLQQETNSTPQPILPEFLKKSLPHLRHSLAMKEISIDGITPPSLSSVPAMSAVISQTQPQQNMTTTTEDLLMNQCRAVLSRLLNLSAGQNQTIATNVKALIQGLVDGKICAENFAYALHRETNSMLCSGVLGLLKKSLPALQRALGRKEIVIDGIQAPPGALLLALFSQPPPQQDRAAFMCTAGQIRVPAAMSITAAPPTPPDWDKSCEAAIQSLTPFVRSLVDTASLEYEVLAELVTSSDLPVSVTKIEKIVNLPLWKKFQSVRKDLLTAKSKDFEILSGLGLSDSELQQQYHVLLNFNPNEGIPDYADNVALLLHCTTGSVDSILSQGLDERLGKDTGLLGRGIYFADDPAKSVQYDRNNVFIVFAVILGDCLYSNTRNSVREPGKTPHQKRHPSDHCFDSIVGRPTAVANEYAIYNRQHCVPLYLIHYAWNYAVGVAATDVGKSYAEARNRLPPFVWNSNPTTAEILDPSHANRWPFFAQTIFELMKPDTPDPVPAFAPTNDNSKIETQLSTLRGLGFTDVESNTQKLIEFGFNLELTIDALLNSTTGTPPLPDPAPASSMPTRPSVIKSTASASAAGTHVASDASGTDPGASEVPLKKAKVDVPASSGKAGDPNLNPETPTNDQGGAEPTQLPNSIPKLKLKRVPSLPTNSWTVHTTTTTLAQSTASASSISASTTKDNFASISTISNPASSSTNRVVANSLAAATQASTQTNGYQSSDADCPICCVQASEWTTLACSHQLCTDCYEKLHTSGQTMSGKTHTCIKCPFCNGVSGIQIGTCPDGVMIISYRPDILPGYESYNTISINYLVNQGKYALNRTGFLPNSPEGQRIMELLRTAWDRRLVFSIGTSLTSEKTDVLVWNIHHKTGLTGGAQAYAYPDPSYLDRLLSELKQFGIE